MIIILFILGAFLLLVEIYNALSKRKKKVDVDVLSSLIEVKSISLSTKRYLELIAKEEELESIKNKIVGD